MKLSTVALASIALFSSATSFAGMLSVSPNIEVLALDGHKVKNPTFSELKNLEISNNHVHQAVISVSDIINQGNNQVLYESDPIIVTFDSHDQNVMLNVPRLRNQFEVNEFKNNPHINVTTQSGQKIPSKQAFLPQEGFLPGLNLIDNIAKYNASNGVASVSSFAMIKKTVPSDVVTNESMSLAGDTYQIKKEKVVVKGQNIAEQQLQFWFQQADKATKARFLKWAKAQK
ncbi:curli polymerization inhibitor CsgI-related protein [Actinobacillus delphinicola]|uniref:UPF0319 protein NCTC12871_01485 n=1 Tax=Actinobacillus delphinicola TaxID=51161 RepID=A0A448TVN0_9PAST|nr:DUF2057 domain-containing protein [Actinobacillus delphinicola]VEJ09987.1 Uncharacterized protein conserved in bacteria (DUF2057) [Actinobacillus delphinicola]